MLWNKTVFGKNIFAIGGNLGAAKVSGVNVPLTLLKVRALSGVFCAFAGLLKARRIGSAINSLGFLYKLDATAACVVEGGSFAGGVVSIIGGTCVLISIIINYGMTYIGINPYWQFIIRGGIIIYAVAPDSMKYVHKK